MTKTTSTTPRDFLPTTPVLACWIVLIVALVYSYWSAIAYVTNAWIIQPADYGHGYFVVPFCLGLLWYRREMIHPLPTQGNWWALAFVAPWILMRVASALYAFQVLDPLSLLPILAGVAVFLGGWRALRWAWPSIMFLIFMMPLPIFIATGFRSVLQRVATKVSVFLIQTFGIPAVIEGKGGNVIQLTEGKLGVVEACSGLRMLMLFFAICVGVALVVRRPVWQKIVMVGCAVPIAVLSNVTRITVTAILYEMARKFPNLITTETADKIFHDWAGFLMMPLGLVMLWGVIAILDRLLIEPDSARPLSLGGSLLATPRPIGTRPPNRPPDSTSSS